MQSGKAAGIINAIFGMNRGNIDGLLVVGVIL
jgi:hypothetical protein